jgi:hypothetical protein
MKLLSSGIVLLLFLQGCAVGYKPWAEQTNELIGRKAKQEKPFTFKDAGKLIRADYLILGEGLTHITKNENGDIVQHWFVSEVLPNFYEESSFFLFTRGNKEWVGKCMYYLVIDPDSYIIKNWGHDKGGNPKSCRHWP